MQELHKLLKDERLAGASLLIFANKQDIPGARNSEEVEKVGLLFGFLELSFQNKKQKNALLSVGLGSRKLKV